MKDCYSCIFGENKRSELFYCLIRNIENKDAEEPFMREYFCSCSKAIEDCPNYYEGSFHDLFHSVINSNPAYIRSIASNIGGAGGGTQQAPDGRWLGGSGGTGCSGTVVGGGGSGVN